MFIFALMNLSKILLFPASLLYGSITGVRNLLFDFGIKEQYKSQLKVISVGNLSLGGTGKTPMIEYLIRLLGPAEHALALISRGYGRKTKGFLVAGKDASPSQIGDEPFQVYSKFPTLKVCVSEKRKTAIEYLEQESPDSVVLLDDAFQHRYVQRDLNIVLTSFDNLFYNDLVLPAGRLREFPSGISRADVVVVTKCPEIGVDKKLIRGAIEKYSDAPVFFSSIKYATKIQNQEMYLDFENLSSKKVALITGIAKPEYFYSFLKPFLKDHKHFKFADHYNFKTSDFEQFENYLNQYPNAILLTTEKDYVRLIQHKWSTESLHRIFYLPIETDFGSMKKDFDSLILSQLQK
ncbi:MAG: tetraacyldisaccharide 4'-kinase [Flavobacteriaceae bacterium]